MRTLRLQPCGALAGVNRGEIIMRLSNAWATALCAVALSFYGVFAQSATDFAFEPAIKFTDITQMQLVDISAAGDRLVAVGERGLIAVSDDAGSTWRQAAVPVSATLAAVFFATAEKGWAVGHSGVILHSNDGGLNWELQFDGVEAGKQYARYTRSILDQLQNEFDQLEATLQASDDEGSDTARLEELEYALEDAIFAEEDARAALEAGPADPFLDVLFLDASTGIAVGAYGMIYRTSDGGKNWLIAADSIDNFDRFHYYALAVDDGGHLYLSGEAGLLYHSGDRGVTWDRVEDLYDGSLFGLACEGDYVIAHGLRGNIFRSADKGNSWSSIDNPTEFSLYGSTVLPGGGIVLVGSGGIVLQSNDKGGSFTAYNHPALSTFSAVVQGAGGKLWAVGMNGLDELDEAKQ